MAEGKFHLGEIVVEQLKNIDTKSWETVNVHHDQMKNWCTLTGLRSTHACRYVDFKKWVKQALK